MNQEKTSLTNSPAAVQQQEQEAVVEPTTTEDDRSRRTRRVFASLAAACGSRLATLWEGTNRATVVDVWTKALGGFEESDLESACNSFVESGDDWPPGLPRFKAMCNLAKFSREAAIARARQGQLKLESHNSEDQQAAIKKARDGLASQQMRRPAVVDGSWAHRAIARHESGECRLMPDALKIAREAVSRAGLREHRVNVSSGPDLEVSPPAAGAENPGGAQTQPQVSP